MQCSTVVTLTLALMVLFLIWSLLVTFSIPLKHITSVVTIFSLFMVASNLFDINSTDLGGRLCFTVLFLLHL